MQPLTVMVLALVVPGPPAVDDEPRDVAAAGLHMHRRATGRASNSTVNRSTPLIRSCPNPTRRPP
ncbi:hypothetical protein ACVOMS_20630 [Bradyrhizobium guangxiense]